MPWELPAKAALFYSFFLSLLKQIGKSVGKLDFVTFNKEQAA